MNARNEENLRELFEKFPDGEQANKAVADVRKGDQILRRHPAPQPPARLIAQIKAKTAEAASRNRPHAFKDTAYKVAAAAAIIIIAVIAVKVFQTSKKEPQRTNYASIIPTALWESDDIAADDADLSLLNAAVEEIEQDMHALRWGENGGNGAEQLVELEIELIEISGDFWKG
jgi:hypothetical protein